MITEKFKWLMQFIENINKILLIRHLKKYGCCWKRDSLQQTNFSTFSWVSTVRIYIMQLINNQNEKIINSLHISVFGSFCSMQQLINCQLLLNKYLNAVWYDSFFFEFIQLNYAFEISLEQEVLPLHLAQCNQMV